VSFDLNGETCSLVAYELQRYYWKEIMGEIMEDKVNHPKHYTSHPSGVEAIEICQHMNFNLGNAMKYVWRADLKGEDIEDLRKAEWYLRKEIERRMKPKAQLVAGMGIHVAKAYETRRNED